MSNLPSAISHKNLSAGTYQSHNIAIRGKAIGYSHRTSDKRLNEGISGIL